MAGRKRIVEAPVFKTWEEVDAALKEIAEEEIAIADIEGEMNKQMNGIKITAAQEAKPHHDRISSLEKDVKQFVTEHRDELGGKKTKTLNFGETGFRKSTSVVIPKDKGLVAEIIRRLKVKKLTDCIITEEKVNKDALRQHGEDVVIAVGARWKQEDAFWYEASHEKLEAQR